MSMTHEEKALLEGIRDNSAYIREYLGDIRKFTSAIGYFSFTAIVLLGLILWRIW
jgi:hypothetical protein